MSQVAPLPEFAHRLARRGARIDRRRMPGKPSLPSLDLNSVFCNEIRTPIRYPRSAAQQGCLTEAERPTLEMATFWCSSSLPAELSKDFRDGSRSRSRISVCCSAGAPHGDRRLKMSTSTSSPSLPSLRKALKGLPRRKQKQIRPPWSAAQQGASRKQKGRR